VGGRRPPVAGEKPGEARVHPRTGEKEALEHAAAGEQITQEPDRARQGIQSLASLLVRAGPLKGRRFEIRVPVVNVGRADYNDIVLTDESVSTVHAKIQRREGIWVLVDQDSTNGTVVDGERVVGETVLTPGALIKFGTVQTSFQPTDDAADVQKGGATRVIQPLDIPPPNDEQREDPSSSDS
jgi:pSer/pThr/pTyr-binding forkhead associated (FHA) protein